MSTLRRRIYDDSYTRQLQPDQIPSALKMAIGPDDAADWPDEIAVVTGYIKDLPLPPTASVVVGAYGDSINFTLPAVVPPQIRISLTDHDTELCDMLTDWAYNATRIRLWVVARLWVTGYLVAPSPVTPEPAERRVVIRPQQIGVYKRDAPDTACADPFDGDAATTITGGGPATFQVLSSAGFNIGDIVMIELAAGGYSETIIQAIPLPNNITVDPAVGGSGPTMEFLQSNAYVWGTAP